MPNTLLTPTAVTREALRVLHQKLNFVGSITREYDDSYAKEGAKIGDSLKIRLPNQYTVGDGATITPQDTTESSVTLQVSTQKHVPMSFTSAELTLSMDDFSERIIEPAVSVLAAKIEADVLSNVYKDVYNQVNNHGASATFNKVLQARKMLVDNLAPINDRQVCLSTQDNVDMVDALTNQITGPASRAIGRTALPIYEKPAAPGSDGFGRAPQRLEGEARDSAFEDVLNSALSSVRAGVPRAWVGGKTAGFERVLPAPKRVAPTPVERKVATAVERAIQRDAMTPADVMARTEKGVPAFHAGGENLTSLAEVAAQSPGPARRVLRSAVRDYSATAPTRVKADIATELGGRGDYFATMEAKQAQRAAKAKPLLEEAFAAPIDPVVFSDKVQPILGRLPKGSLEQAYDIARREGRNPVDMGFEVSPASGDLPAMVTVKNPTTETLHYVKKGIDQTLEQYRNPVTRELDLSGSPGAQVDSQVRKTLARTMRDINPKYDEGMKVWGDESERLNALELGRNVFSPKMDMKAERLKGMVDDLSEAARDDFRKGVGEAVLDRVRGSRGDVGVMRDLLKNEEFGDRVALAFPDDASFARFMESAAKRVAEQDRNNQVFGGSPTYARQAARADLEAEGNPAIEMAADVLTLDGKALGKKALSAGLKSRNPSIISNPVMNELLGKVMADPDELTALLNLLQASRASSASRAAIARQAAVPALTQAAAQKDR